MFKNRKDAAEQLALGLERYRNKRVLVLGIPRGGAEIAFYIAQYLNADMSLVVARKLGYPSEPEAAFGAVAEDGSLYISDEAKENLTQEEMNEVLWREKREIQRRIQSLRQGEPLPDLKGKTVIVVDDGIATGATLLATLQLCKNKKAGKIIVAAPICGRQMERVLHKMADEVVILETPAHYHGVSQGYAEFRNLTEEEALTFMNNWKKEHAV